jgi:hypothetical protein
MAAAILAYAGIACESSLPLDLEAPRCCGQRLDLVGTR